ncbi:pentatricopeptide repeat-containing protein At3g18970-like [Phoenix dactylifera]|uniref:Pentatricopeptide repeat-containing protein At3g18970-like n=1 Tax=Phoenix dactylifera TaxID=42345 RepID=A0A8B7BK45_PHODC|nr:pentatricopeptide repeat-containing protein At3g18970-like [Phoenix dactylifera]
MIANSLLCQPLAVGKLIERYFAVLGGADDARLVFRHADVEPEGRAFVWNVMIRCCPPQESLLLYAQEITRKRVIMPDSFTYTYVLRACARLSALTVGRQVHAQILKAVVASPVAVQTTAIYFYASCKDIDSARHLFDEMTTRSRVTWNALMTGYCVNGLAKEALALLKTMLEEGMKPTDRTAVSLLSACSQLGDLAMASAAHAYVYKTVPFHQDCLFIGTGLIDMYSKCGCLSSASRVFERMSKRNVLTWSAMMTGLAFHGKGKAAMELLEVMEKDGVAPNAITFTCLLSACCHAGLVDEGLHLFDAMDRFGVEPRMQHYGCMVDLLGRAGMVEEAHGFVKRMPVEPDAVVWRALLGACVTHGHVELGEEVGKILLQIERAATTTPRTCEDFLALSNVYASAERWEDVTALREAMRHSGVRNRAGCSSV